MTFLKFGTYGWATFQNKGIKLLFWFTVDHIFVYKFGLSDAFIKDSRIKIL